MTTKPAPPSPDPLVQRLVDDAFGDPWNYAVRATVIDRIWEEAGGADRLVAIAADRAAPPKGRFLAGEVLFERDRPAIVRVGESEVATIYARALVDNLTGRASSWGLLWQHRDEGPVGIRFLMIGEDAIPALRALLDDSRETMTYDGSEEATVGNAYHFRIKDYAAYYLSKVTNIRLPYAASAADRDRAIADLAARLPPP